MISLALARSVIMSPQSRRGRPSNRPRLINATYSGRSRSGPRCFNESESREPNMQQRQSPSSDNGNNLTKWQLGVVPSGGWRRSLGVIRLARPIDIA